eukprot:SAG31_NODE_2290_length_5999_cov_3.229661_3_plen_158_part_00
MLISLSYASAEISSPNLEPRLTVFRIIYMLLVIRCSFQLQNDGICKFRPKRMINYPNLHPQFLLREFGHEARPTVGWHVDPFGHSASTASLWSSMGFDAFGLERIDEREKDRRRLSKSLEFIWRGSDSLGAETQIFAHILDSHYSSAWKPRPSHHPS